MEYAIYALRALVVLSVLVLIVGMIKPKWILWWAKTPDRLSVTMIALLMFMGGMTGIAKLTLKPKEHQEQKKDERSVDQQNEINLGR